VSVFDQDIDKKIRQHQQQIAELEQLKKDQEKKIEGLKEFDVAIKRLCNQNALTEDELYVSRSEQIEAWLVGMAKSESPSSIYNNLKRHFEKTLNREAKKGDKKASSLPKPKLAVGTYRNPATQEKVEKIKRNPRQLDQWIDEHGIQIVRTWKID
jgi:TolA-binding protein|tara:strand:- start:1203 stop:1667 length:465 start_codon:yes stop_codon:yes gene_type:complete